MGRGIIIDNDQLYNEYIVKGDSIAKLTKVFNCSTDTIHKRLKKLGWVRNISEAQKNKCSQIGVHNQMNLDIDVVKKLYLEDGLTTYQVATIIGCSQYKIWKTLSKLNLVRSVKETVKCRVISNETKNKLRLHQINRISKAFFNGGQVFPNYNTNSIQLINQYATENNLKVQHAENGGEYYIEGLGYWVDGYDKEKNIVIEFDEKHHNRQTTKDLIRQTNIINHLKCTFIRLDENGNIKLKIDNHE